MEKVSSNSSKNTDCGPRRAQTEVKQSLLILSTYFPEGNGTPLQSSCLENPMDGGAWQAVVHGVAKSRTPLSDFTFTFHFHALEKEMATHSSVLVWKIPGTGEPGGLPSMGSHRVRHDGSDLAAAAVVYICQCYSLNLSHPSHSKPFLLKSVLVLITISF